MGLTPFKGSRQSAKEDDNIILQPNTVMNTCKPTSRRIVFALIYMSLVLVSSLIPMDRQIRGLEFIIGMKPAIQNLLHVPMYFVLSIFLLQILPKSRFGTWKRYFLVLVIAALFGIVNEIIQITVPGRYGGTVDMMLNFAGALLGIVFFSLVEKSRWGIMRRIVCE